jgi:hypothetical protein
MRWILLGSVAAALAVLALRPVTALEIENAAAHRTLHVSLPPGGAFSVTYHHSMYDRPVTEEFVLDPDGRIVLQAVASPSAAVREYFGLVGAGERHVVVRAMREVVFRIAAGAPQLLRAGGRERSFLEFGEHGDRLVVRATRRPALALYLSARRAAA